MLRNVLFANLLLAMLAPAAGEAAGSCAAAEKEELAFPTPLPPHAYTTLKGGMTICRVVSGLWQLSGGHGYRPQLEESIQDMDALVDAGFVTFDLADHYGPAEDFVGAYIASKGSTPPGATFHTKWVPRPGPMGEGPVARALEVSRGRMKTRVLDLVAFHWWDYNDKRYLEMMRSAQLLAKPKAEVDGGEKEDKRPMLRAVSLTNFDTTRLREIIEEGGVDVVDGGMVAVAKQHGVALLCYGTLLGGLLSEAWLDRPAPRSRADLPTASLGKYYQWVASWGSWELFQELLHTMKRVADAHTAAEQEQGQEQGEAKKAPFTIANVATRWVLQQSTVAATIVGMRLGHTAQRHIAENSRVFDFTLDEGDLRVIAAVQRKGRRLLDTHGDCGDEYRQ